MRSRIIFSVAHNPRRRGARGGGHHEWEWSQRFCGLVREYMDDCQPTVLIDTPNWKTDKAVLAALGPRRGVVEPHLNASKDRRVNYGVVIRSDTVWARRMAQRITDAMEEILGWHFLRPRGWQGGFPRARRLTEEASPAFPALLLELGFVTNPTARMRLFDEEIMDRSARAVAGCLSG